MKRLVAHPESCTGCRLCEMACSLVHENVVNPKKARIRIEKTDVGSDVPVVCTQCGECIDVCPQDAISLDNGLVKIDSHLCIGCGLCVDACPYNIITMEDNIAIKCDLCGGDPVCVKYCSQGGIRFEEAGT